MGKGKKKSPSNANPTIPGKAGGGGISWHSWAASSNLKRAKEADHKQSAKTGKSKK